MKSIVAVIIAINATCGLISCPKWNNSVRSLPEMDILKIICSYSGFINVDTQNSTKYFYWFFLKEYYTHLQSTPIIFYIGDGLTSTFLNIFSALGPIQIYWGRYLQNYDSYTNISNIVYVDLPGIGFSITDNMELRTAQDLSFEFYSFI